ncbi:TetR/AcrR family transcriptional regulator [Corynebacterium lubricantis]|uniref:TetR/AcrR family transcriptional regulator n=1 Tax=Corynebacterium lubricantis TaxID=541095 RepID=UPI00036F4140|nr:TetR/AcrR family transcriptional regulator [Corynebacterium lubricantis]
MPKPSLRDQKRKQTSHELSRTAFEFTKERGLDGFTIDDVVNEVGVSRRTFANYFSCKEEAVAALALEQLEDGIETLPEMPEDTPLLDWVRTLALHQLSGGMFDLLIELRDLAHKDPALKPFVENVHAEIRRTAQSVVSAQAKNSAAKFAAPIIVGAAYGALNSFIDAGSAQSGTSLDEFVETVFSKLKAGL